MAGKSDKKASGRREEMEKLLERIRVRESALKGAPSKKHKAGEKTKPKQKSVKIHEKKVHVQHKKTEHRQKIQRKPKPPHETRPHERIKAIISHKEKLGHEKPDYVSSEPINHEVVEEPENKPEPVYDSKDYLETDIDKLYKLVSKNGMVRISDATKDLKVTKAKIEEWGRILEEHDLILLHYPPFGEPVLILKKFQINPKIKVKKSGSRKINLVILSGIAIFVVFILIYTGRLRIPYQIEITSQMVYLAALPIILILLILIFRKIKKSRKKKMKGGEPHGKKDVADGGKTKAKRK